MVFGSLTARLPGGSGEGVRRWTRSLPGWFGGSVRAGRTLLRSIVALVLAAALVACDVGPLGPDGSHSRFGVGLDGQWVWAMAVDEERMYAGTRDGLFARSRDGGKGDWAALGLEGHRVNDLVAYDDGSLLAAVQPPGPGTDTLSLFRSPDRGETWEPYQRGFGGESGHVAVQSLARLPDGTFLAGGPAVVARLEPGDERWEPVAGDWDGFGVGVKFITLDPSDSSIVWAGGETGLLRPFVMKSTDGGETWKGVPTESDGDNGVKSAAVDPRDSNRVFAGWEGRVKRSRNGGETWETVLRPESYPYFYGLAVGRPVPGRIYAAGARNDPELQDLVLRWSDDGGETWTSLREERAGGVLSMLVTPEDEMYLGTQDGVYRVVPDR